MKTQTQRADRVTLLVESRQQSRTIHVKVAVGASARDLVKLVKHEFATDAPISLSYKGKYLENLVNCSLPSYSILQVVQPMLVGGSEIADDEKLVDIINAERYDIENDIKEVFPS